MNRFHGKFLAICRDHHDPWMAGRIRAEVPYPLGRGPNNWSIWAMPCLPPGHFDVPEEGQGVWIEFLGGDPAQPVWTGVWYRGSGPNSEAPLQDVHPVLTDMAGNEADTDKRDHTETDPVSHAEHRKFHDHAGEFYTPHRRVWQSASGHQLEWNDHPGREGGLRLFERFGRFLEMTSKGILRLSARLTGIQTGNWKNLDGEDIDAAHELVMADLTNEEDQYILLRDMAQASLRFTSTPGNENVSLSDFWSQHVKVNSVNGSEYIELLDKVGQSLRLDVATGTVRVRDQEGNFVLLENGQITVQAVSGNIVLNVPEGSNVHVGGEGGEELATRTMVETYFNLHTHVSGSPGSPTSPPMQPAPLTPGHDITNKQKSE